MSALDFIKNIEIKGVILRFWLALLFSMIASVTAFIWITRDSRGYADSDIFSDYLLSNMELQRIMMVTIVGFLGAINWKVLVESQLTQRRNSVICLGILLLSLGGYYYYLTRADIYDSHVIFRFIGIALFLHLTISYIPFLFKSNLPAFWEYNRRLFSHFFTSAFFTLVIFLGISLALLALEYLFGMDNNRGKIYGQLIILLAGIFHPIYFLSEFPRNIDQLQPSRLKKSFRIFVVYILIPISILYLIILYAYGIKIGLEMSLPKGWVSKLVLSFCIIGILSYLLNYMFPLQSKSKLSSHFKKYFFPFLLIPIALLFVAIYVRISDYGITEPRYIVSLLGAWLLFISVYIIISKTDNIKVIPLTLSAIVLISLFGPLNMFKVSLQNQFAILKNTLTENGLLIDGKLVKANDLNQGIQNQIVHKIKYLYHEDELSLLTAYSSDSVDLTFLKNQNKIRKFSLVRETCRALGVKESFNSTKRKNNYTYLNTNIKEALDVSEFNHFGFFNQHQDKSKKYELSHIDGSLKFRLQYPPTIDQEIDLTTFINNLLESEGRVKTTEEMSYIFKEDSITFKIIFTSLGLENNDNFQKINNYAGYILIK